MQQIVYSDSRHSLQDKQEYVSYPESITDVVDGLLLSKRGGETFCSIISLHVSAYYSVYSLRILSSPSAESSAFAEFEKVPPFILSAVPVTWRPKPVSGTRQTGCVAPKLMIFT